MHNTPLTLQERLSAFADGELPAQDIAALLDAMEADPTLTEAWTLHHAQAALIRGERVEQPSGDLAFWHKVQQGLGDTTPVHFPAATTALAPTAAVRRSRNAANASYWRQGLVASIVVAAAGVMSVMWWPVAESNVAQAPAQTLVTVASRTPSAEKNLMLRDPALDALMAAHQQLGGHSAWQAPSGFLRNATFERPAR